MQLDPEQQELALLRRLLVDGHPGATLEVGCGAGRVTEMLRQIVKGEMLAIDADPELIREAKQTVLDVRFQTRDFEKFCATAENTPDQFSLIVFSMSLHHLPDPVAALRQASTLLLEEGRILIIEPEIDSQVTEIVSLVEPDEKMRIERAGIAVTACHLDLIAEEELKLSWHFDSFDDLCAHRKIVTPWQHLAARKFLGIKDGNAPVHLTDRVHYFVFYK
jgi:SAM-dependent methyltransferase